MSKYLPQLGDKSSAVRFLKQFLNSHPNVRCKLKQDDVFDSETRAALAQFQKYKGLRRADGEVNIEAWAMIGDGMLPVSRKIAAYGDRTFHYLLSQTTSHGCSNPNCMTKIVEGSPGLARIFKEGHDGVHARSPVGKVAKVKTLPPLVGKVEYLTSGGNKDLIVDVELTSGGYAIYKDLKQVFVKKGDPLKAGSVIGTVYPGKEDYFGRFTGCHLTLVRSKEIYKEYRRLSGLISNSKDPKVREAASKQVSLSMFIDPMSDQSPVRCPNNEIIDVRPGETPYEFNQLLKSKGKQTQ